MEVKSDKNFELNADIDTIWNVLINPEKVVTCVPGAELADTIDENHLKGKVIIKIGPVTANFNGNIEIEKREISDYELAMKGKGSDITGKGGASMDMRIKLNAIERSPNQRDIDNDKVQSMIDEYLAYPHFLRFKNRIIIGILNNKWYQFLKFFALKLTIFKLKLIIEN